MEGTSTLNVGIAPYAVSIRARWAQMAYRHAFGWVSDSMRIERYGNHGAAAMFSSALDTFAEFEALAGFPR
jgi:hypothetical protein